MKIKFTVIIAVLLAVFMVPAIIKKDKQPNSESNTGTSVFEAEALSDPTKVVNNVDFVSTSNEPITEMRAAWVATVTNIDMPAGMDKAAFTAWANNICANLESKNFNTVVFQVKPLSDALYKSAYAPWSQYITGGKQGADPGYDPLEIMIDAAHSRGLELHAWINPYRVTMPKKQLADLADNNIAKKCPGWVNKYSDQYYLNPGIPDVRKYLSSCVSEIVANYDVDAIHMDDYFYPYAIAGENYPDDYTFKVYGNGFTNKSDWRRNNVNLLVKDVNETIKKIKPHVQFGISPFGVWRNASFDKTGSNTKAGQATYDTLYGDSRYWIKQGYIDYLTPQIYWSRQHKLANYSVLLDWWNKEIVEYAGVHPVNLYIGVADYKVNNGGSDEPFKAKEELFGQINDNRAAENALGQMHFSYKSIVSNQLAYMDLIKDGLYKNKALTPSTYWNNETEVFAPSKVSALAVTNGVKLTITDEKNQKDVHKYAIYRVSKGEYLDFTNPENLIGVVYKSSGGIFVDNNAVKGKSYQYAVKALSGTNVISNDESIINITF